MDEDYKRYGMLEKISETALNNHDVLRCCISMKNYNENLYDHSCNVAFLSLLLGESYYKNLDEILELFIAALLHDYGKMYIARSILDKPGPLTTDERKTIEMHSVMGYLHLKAQTNFSNNILNGILDHHEKADGSGYSKGKISSDISNYAKIITLADVYDAMISDRVYRGRIQRDSVHEYIIKNAGTSFDKELAKMFLNQVNEISNLAAAEMKFKIILAELQRKKYLIVS